MKKVIGIFKRDDSIAWCYCKDGNLKEISSALLGTFNDYDSVISLVKNDIHSFRGTGYIKDAPLKSQRPFQDYKSMLKALEEDTRYFFLFDEFDGWIITTNSKKKSLKNYLKSKEAKEIEEE